jgi:ligand-binding sensor domain-containing protein
VVIQKGGAWITYDTADGMASNMVNCIEVDKNNIKWIGTTKGLCKFDGTNWTIYDTSNSDIPSDNVSAVFMDKQGYLWVGTRNSGIARFGQGTWQGYEMKAGSGGYYAGDKVHAVIQDNAGDIWVGAEGEYRTSPYAGYYGHGLARYNNTSWTIYNSILTHSIYHVQDFSLGPNGELWAAVHGVFILYRIMVDGRLLRYENGQWTTYTRSNSGLPQNDCNALAHDRNNVLWIGTDSKGIVKYDGLTWEVMDDYDGLIDTNVNAIAVDSLNNKCMSMPLR